MVTQLNGASLYSTLNKLPEREVVKSAESPKESAPKSRAEEIKEQIARGEYKVDLNKTAEKMAQHLLG